MKKVHLYEVICSWWCVWRFEGVWVCVGVGWGESVVCESVHVGECIGEVMPIGNNETRILDAVFRSLPCNKQVMMVFKTAMYGMVVVFFFSPSCRHNEWLGPKVFLFAETYTITQFSYIKDMCEHPWRGQYQNMVPHFFQTTLWDIQKNQELIFQKFTITILFQLSPKPEKTYSAIQ